MARTRFAPSPTGSLHVGGARTALYCLLQARATEGSFVLRIEDTDRARSTDEAAAGIVRDLEWLGLQWDEGPGRGGDVGPYYQSQRLDMYDAAIQRLLDAGDAYEAWEDRQELGAMRKEAEAAKTAFRYHRRPYSDADLERFKGEGRTPVVRLASKGVDVTHHDVVLGEVVVTGEHLDDLVLRKADGFPTYHFAVVIDDHHMDIGLILRGQEHLMNTHKHRGIFDALGWEPPQAGHLPLIFNPTGSKMSKRDKAKAARAGARQAQKAGSHVGWDWLAQATGLSLDEVTRFMKKKHDGVSTAEAIAAALEVELPMIEVLDFRRGGVLPEALLNYLALLGWSPGQDREIMSLDEMCELFSMDRVVKTPAKFDSDKLFWMSGEYMKSMPIEALLERNDQYLAVADSPLAGVDRDTRGKLIDMYRPRARTFAELDLMADFFINAPTDYAAKAAQKHLLKGDGLARLAAVRDPLSTVEDWSEDHLERTLTSFVEAHEWNLGKVAQPLRVALSGAAATPGLFETLAMFDKPEVLRRIDAALAHFSDAA